MITSEYICRPVVTINDDARIKNIDQLILSVFVITLELLKLTQFQKSPKEFKKFV